MDKTKASICITGLLMCAMSYANITTTRGELRLPETDTIALAYVSAAPEAIAMNNAAQLRRNERKDAGMSAEAASTAPARAAVSQQAEQQFNVYLRLHQSRVETAPAGALQFAATH